MSRTLKERLDKPMGFGGRKSPFKNPELEASIAQHNLKHPVSPDEARKKIARFKKAKRK